MSITGALSKLNPLKRIRGLNRRWLWAGALLAVAGVPLAVSSRENVQKFAIDSWKSVNGGVSGSSSTDSIRVEFAQVQPRPLDVPIEGPPVKNLGEVLRFDVTTAWVMGRWPRVSTGLSEVDLQGYRVALVTGTAEHDLAGALTYYFNRNQRVQKLTFRGTTGDARPLVSQMARRHGLTRQPNSDPAVHLYQRLADGKPVAEMRIRPSRIIRANRPNRRFEVELEITRPRGAG